MYIFINKNVTNMYIFINKKRIKHKKRIKTSIEGRYRQKVVNSFPVKK